MKKPSETCRPLRKTAKNLFCFFLLFHFPLYGQQASISEEGKRQEILQKEFQKQAELQLRYAEEQYRLGNRWRAYQIFRDFLVLYPRQAGHFTALMRLGDILDGWGRRGEALARYTQAYQISGQDTESARQKILEIQTEEGKADPEPVEAEDTVVVATEGREQEKSDNKNEEIDTEEAFNWMGEGIEEIE